MSSAAKGPFKSLNDIPSVFTIDAKVEWLVSDWFTEGSVNLITGRSGDGKSYLAQHLADAVAHGTPVFGTKAVQASRPVLYIDKENPLAVVKKRLPELGIAETPNLLIWGGWCDEEPAGPNHPLVEDFAKSKPLIIWDSLVRFHSGEEQSATDTSRFMGLFRKLANLGATVVILHHTGKSEGSQEYRGSSDIPAAVDSAFKVRRLGAQSGPLDKLLLEPFKTRITPLDKITVQFVLGVGFKEITKINPVETVREIVNVNPGLNQSEIVERAARSGISKAKVRDVLESEVFRSEPGEKPHEKVYYLANPL